MWLRRLYIFFVSLFSPRMTVCFASDGGIIFAISWGHRKRNVFVKKLIKNAISWSCSKKVKTEFYFFETVKIFLLPKLHFVEQEHFHLMCFVFSHMHIGVEFARYYQLNCFYKQKSPVFHVSQYLLRFTGHSFLKISNLKIYK